MPRQGQSPKRLSFHEAAWSRSDVTRVRSQGPGAGALGGECPRISAACPEAPLAGLLPSRLKVNPRTFSEPDSSALSPPPPCFLVCRVPQGTGGVPSCSALAAARQSGCAAGGPRWRIQSVSRRCGRSPFATAQSRNGAGAAEGPKGACCGKGAPSEGAVRNEVLVTGDPRKEPLSAGGCGGLVRCHVGSAIEHVGPGYAGSCPETQGQQAAKKPVQGMEHGACT